MKAVLAANRDTGEVWALFEPWLTRGVQFRDVDFDPAQRDAPHWKDTAGDRFLNGSALGSAGRSRRW
jgi:hypothetical protein